MSGCCRFWGASFASASVLAPARAQAISFCGSFSLIVRLCWRIGRLESVCELVQVSPSACGVGQGEVQVRS